MATIRHSGLTAGQIIVSTMPSYDPNWGIWDGNRTYATYTANMVPNYAPVDVAAMARYVTFEPDLEPTTHPDVSEGDEVVLINLDTLEVITGTLTGIFTDTDEGVYCYKVQVKGKLSDYELYEPTWVFDLETED